MSDLHLVVAGVVVGLGCERFSPYELAEGIASTNKMLETVVIQEEGDSLKAIQEGTKYAREMQQIASRQQREEVDISELTIALNCGGVGYDFRTYCQSGFRDGFR